MEVVADQCRDSPSQPSISTASTVAAMAAATVAKPTIDLPFQTKLQGESPTRGWSTDSPPRSPGPLRTIRKEGTGSSGSVRHRPSTMPAYCISIGEWTRESIIKGDMLAKIYYTKQLFVWEYLKRGLKHKMAIPFEYVTGIKIEEGPEEKHATLRVVIGRQPKFFDEKNPVPKSNTQWEPTMNDFAEGYGWRSRQHRIVCKAAILRRNVYKLRSSCSRMMRLLDQGLPDDSRIPLEFSEEAVAHARLRAVAEQHEERRNVQIDLAAPLMRVAERLELHSRSLSESSTSSMPTTPTTSECGSSDNETQFTLSPHAECLGLESLLLHATHAAELRLNLTFHGDRTANEC